MQIVAPRLRVLVSCVLLSSVVLLVPASGWAQSQPSPLPGVFGEVLDVRVVNLEVVVTDRRGLPIAGLEAGDFRLVIDGEEVPIDYFSEVRGGVAVPEGVEEQPPPVPGVPQLAPGRAVQTSYLVFIDEYFSVAVDRNQVLDALMDDLGRFGPEDRMAVVAYDGRGLEMLSNWSQSVTDLERVLKRAKERRTGGLQRLAERRQARIDEAISLQSLVGVSLEGDTRPGIDRVFLEPQERFYVQRLAEQLDRSVAAATATLRSFAKPPGRKVMILLSGGWPFFPIEYLYSDFNRLILDREGLEGDDLYGRLTDTANLLGYTLYPVDVPGLSREAIRDVTLDNAPDPRQLANQDFLREQENHYTLQRLAERTGGRAFLNAQRLEAFDEIVSDTRSYYWLGFTPGREWDDRRHDVRIELSNPDFRVRSRAGYLDSSRQREVTMAVESTLLFGNSPGEGALDVVLGEPTRAGRNRVDVGLTVLVPLDGLTFLPAAEGYVTQLELRIAVIDEDGQRAEIPIIPISLATPGEPEAGQVGRYETELRLRKKDHQGVVAVYDTASGRILSSTIEISL